jgi:hypothetical protein
MLRKLRRNFAETIALVRLHRLDLLVPDLSPHASFLPTILRCLPLRRLTVGGKTPKPANHDKLYATTQKGRPTFLLDLWIHNPTSQMNGPGDFVYRWSLSV